MSGKAPTDTQQELLKQIEARKAINEKEPHGNISINSMEIHQTFMNISINSMKIHVNRIKHIKYIIGIV